MAFTAARTSMLRGRPPGFPSGIIESTNAHCASVKSVAYVLIPVSKNLERSLRIRLVTARTFQTASQHRAGAALPMVAALLGAGEVEVLAQTIQKRGARIDPQIVFPSVNGERDRDRVFRFG